MDKDKIQRIADELAESMYGKDFYDLSGRQQSEVYDKAIVELNDMMADKADMMRKNEADGGRIGFSEGGGYLDYLRAVKELGCKFPIILKSSTGTQTGVGVTIVESMRSLNAFIQMILFYNKYLPIIIQEYIPLDYDVRVMVLDGEILGAMKRKVITDGSDFRSNVSLGAEAEKIEITEIEKDNAIKAAEAVDGKLVGIDFIPAKNREKEQPYILEENSMPGYRGIQKIQKGLTQEILEHFKNRDKWRK